MENYTQFQKGAIGVIAIYMLFVIFSYFFKAPATYMLKGRPFTMEDLNCEPNEVDMIEQMDAYGNDTSFFVCHQK